MLIGKIIILAQQGLFAVADFFCFRKMLSNEKLAVSSKTIYIPIIFAVLFFSFASPTSQGFAFWLVSCFMGILTSCGIFIYCRKRKKVLLLDKKYCFISLLSASIISVSQRNDLAERILRGTERLCLMLKISLSSSMLDLCNMVFLLGGTLSCFFVFAVFTYFFYKWFYRHVKLIARDISPYEKKELMIIWILYVVLIAFSYTKTNVFYNISCQMDVIYTSDTGLLYDTNTWLVLRAPQNDIRQPLFALFSAPICVLPYFISNIFFFIPNMYAYLLAFIQAFFILSSFLIICRMTEESNIIERMFLFAMLSTTFPAFLFILNMEQYAFALFWVVLYLYFLCIKKESKKRLWFPLIAAGGTLMTSWILLLTTWTRGKILENIRYCLKNVVFFFVLCIVYFRASVIAGAINDITSILTRFSSLSPSAHDNCGFYDRVVQFSNFAYSCVFAPKSVAVNNSSFWSYQLCKPVCYNILGIVLFCFALFGCWVDRKKTIAKVSLLWIALSVLLLLVIGYGTVENGTVLYTLYFSWAYYVLIFSSLCWIVPLSMKFRSMVFCGIVILQIAINFPAVLRLIQFGINYYPAQ